MPLLVALVAAGLRWPLLWDDPWAPGYDGGYYLLQVGSWLDGAPIFADRSLVFPVLAVFARVSGDVLLGNKIAATTFAALTAGLGAWGAWRWLGSWLAALTLGLCWACSPLHLGISAEFLKNAGGLVVLAAVFAQLPGCRGWRLVPLALSLALGLGVHKLTGLLGLGLAASTLVLRRDLPRWIWPVGAALLAVAALGVGVLRPEDFERFLGGGQVPRSQLFSETLSRPERLELLVLLGSPVLLLLALRERADLRELGLPMALLGGICTALYLPFGWDLSSWRLMLMGFVPVGGLAALAVHRVPWLAAGVLPWVLLSAVPAAQHQALREPDYSAWAGQLPVIRAAVPEEDRVVAHRGLCGFIWSEGGRVCENFQPQGDLSGWWRVAYGMGERRLAPYSESPVPLLPGYTLVRESEWQAFREDHVGRFSLLTDERNPWQPRPGFVYGPEASTP